MSNTATVPSGALTEFAAALLIRAGTPAAHGQSVAEALTDADMEGLPSHGLMLLPMYLDRIRAGSVAPAAQGRIVSDTGTQIVIDGENGFGHVIGDRAASLAAARAQQHGLGAVAVRDTFHFGAAGRFAKAIALSGCVGIVMANTRPLLPAPGGADRVVGNNPIAFAVPTQQHPIVLDLALSAGAMGKIRLAESKGETIPDGWALNADGLPTTDPAEAIKGILLPAAGPKGFGLALLIDLLAGGLSSGAIGDAVQPLYGDPGKPYGCANLFVAIDIAGFRPLADFNAATSSVANKIRASRRAPGATEIRLPGDRAEHRKRDAQGAVTIATATLAALRTCAARLNVAIPTELSI
ncbi:Ldh family oxidoreductase [Bradyrhizobium sp. CCGUVB1N3]|uniref:Ldh family oxidoreductase n=1 Tax=Bradyrhizobium sp. CCGUVB1N3 TaxID=2949629 RepID=UPI0020B3184C|nr:Ldh family oxidoreductase [Bradyrhizobium sp. CCGUVB1N3]MCP3469054.1 Ldh family oxidoreductase [Bradyrhizobium sp. CCGUVB1N3]